MTTIRPGDGLEFLREEEQRLRAQLRQAASPEARRSVVAKIATHLEIERLLVHSRLHSESMIPLSGPDNEHMLGLLQQLLALDSVTGAEELRNAIDACFAGREGYLVTHGSLPDAATLAAQIEKLRPFAEVESLEVLQSRLPAGASQCWIG